MNNVQMVTVDNDIVIRVMNRLRAEGWHKVLGVDPAGNVYSLSTRNGEFQPDEAYDHAFLDSYREELFNNKPLPSASAGEKV